MFLRNLANWDRTIRAVVGVGIWSLAFWGPRTQWGWLGVILVITAVLGHCPMYVMLGIRTCSRDSGKPAR